MSQRRHTDRIAYIIIHCAATPDGRNVTAADIDGWHKRRGFKRNPALAQHSPLKHIGYHYVIRVNGAVESARREDETGAHCVGYNANGIGICLVGTEKYTLAQWQALRDLVALLQKRYPAARVLGHRDTSPDTNGNGRVDPQEWLKTCPGFEVKDWRAQDMRPLIDHLLDAPDAPQPQT